MADRIVRLAQADNAPGRPVGAGSQAAEAGDPLALGIVRQAAEHLAATVRRVHRSGPVVLAGSVLTSQGPVRQAVRELLAGETVATARDAAGAAAWLAARDLLPEADRRASHAAFTAGLLPPTHQERRASVTAAEARCQRHLTAAAHFPDRLCHVFRP